MIRCACGRVGARVCYVCEQNSNRARGTSGPVSAEVELTEKERIALNVDAIRAFESRSKSAQTTEQWFDAQAEFIEKTR